MDTCPHCESSLRGEEIPEELRDSDTHHSLVIDVEILGLYDGALFHECPFCGGRWHRWPEGHRLHAAAERYVDP